MGERPEAAKRRIEVFRKRFGDAHLYLAYHAAFPLALTPDLLYRLRTNFQRDIHGENLNIPWIAVADLLLSRLCSEVGYELYEMDVAVRTELLNQLRAHPKFGPLRINDLSNFLVKYVRQQLVSHDRDIHDFAQAQYWTALAATRPNEAARSIALTLSRLDPGDRAEFARLGSLIETFTEPSTEFTQLLAYARGMEQYARGDEATGKVELGKMVREGQAAQVEGVNLPIPERLRRETREEGERLPTSRRNFFISYHNADRAWAEWIAWQLEEDGYSVMLQFWDFQPGADFTHEINAITQIAERIIIVLSPDYLNAFSTMPGWVGAFAEDPRSKDKRHTLIAVQVHECISKLENMLGPVDYTDLVGLDEPNAREILLTDVHYAEGVGPAILLGFSDGFQRLVSEQPQFPGMPTLKPTSAIEIFCCYAHEDQKLLLRLKANLKPLQRQGLIDTWRDRDVSATSEWEREISEQLNTAHIILLLISPDFMHSDYCYGIEMKRAMERHERGEVRVIPIILRPSYWQNAPFGKLQALPTDAEPVTSWPNQEEAFRDVTRGIYKAVKESGIGFPPETTQEENLKTELKATTSAILSTHSTSLTLRRKRALLVLTGGRPLPDILTLLYLQPELVVVITPQEGWPFQRAFVDIAYTLPACKVEIVANVNAFDIDACMHACAEACLPYPDTEWDWTFTISSSTRMMGLAGYELAKQKGIPCWQVDALHEQVISLVKETEVDIQRFFHLTVDEYMKSYGYTTAHNGLATPNYQGKLAAWSNIARELIHSPDTEIILNLLRRRVVGEEIILPSELKKSTLLRSLERDGLLKITQYNSDDTTTCCLTSRDSAHFLDTGNWLEFYVWHEVTKAGFADDCQWGYRIISGRALFEIDLALTYKARLLIAECSIDRSAFRDDKLARLDSTANLLGGGYVSKLLITNQSGVGDRIYEYFCERARLRNIVVVTKEDLPTIGSILKQEMTTPTYPRI